MASRSRSRGRRSRRASSYSRSRSPKRRRGLSALSIRSRSSGYRSRSRSQPMFTPTQRTVGTMAGAAAGYMSGGFSGAYSGYKTARKLMSQNVYRNVSFGRGLWSGRFKKPRANRMTMETKAMAKGYHSTEEKFASITDPHCIYVQHSTWNLDVQVRTMLGALYRKIFQKAGIAVNSRLQELPLTSPTSSLGFRLDFTHINPITGAETTVAYDTVEDESITTLTTNWAAINALFLQFMANQNQNEPHKMRLYLNDNGVVGSTPRIVAELNLRQESMEIHMSSHLKVQNRTSGAEATEGELGDLDRVDVQPLHGVLYNHTGADPRLRTIDTSPTGILNIPISRMQRDGLQAFGGTGIGLTGTFQYEEPPNPKYFVNCNKSSKIAVQPGAIKSCYIAYTVKGRVNRICKNMSALAFGTTNGADYFSTAIGRSQTVALEELIRTTTTNPITVQFERQYKCGVVLKTKKESLFLTQYSAVPET